MTLVEKIIILLICIYDLHAIIFIIIAHLHDIYMDIAPKIDEFVMISIFFVGFLDIKTKSCHS